jgi:lipopolysaccharide export system protein LptC
MTRTAPWLPLGLLVLLVALTVWLNQLVQSGGMRNGGAERHDPDLIVENFTAHKLGPDGTVRYTLVARKMTHFPDDDSSLLEAVRFVSDDAGKQPLRATSERGQLIDGGDKVVMEGSVVIHAEATPAAPAWRLTTPRLTLLPDENVAMSDEGVRVESSEGSLTAASFVLDTGTRIVKMKQIKATFQRAQS